MVKKVVQRLKLGRRWEGFPSWSTLFYPNPGAEVKDRLSGPPSSQSNSFSTDLLMGSLQINRVTSTQPQLMSPLLASLCLAHIGRGNRLRDGGSLSSTNLSLNTKIATLSEFVGTGQISSQRRIEF